MKLGRLVVAGLFVLGASSVHAGVEFPFSVHKIQNLKLKAAALEDGKIKTSNIKEKDVAEQLCARELTGDEKLAAYVPCPAEEFLSYGGFYLGVFDFDTGLNASGCVVEHFDFAEDPIVETKDGVITQIRGVADGDIDEVSEGDPDVNLYFSFVAKFKTVKDNDNESGLDGLNCAKNLKTKSVVGYEDESENAIDFVIQSGTINTSGVKDGATGTEIFVD